ncbi:MAG: choice-of-anchor E domain-containing protein [Verrucomicrobiales bacterium]|nr:choice-of-anchor E domain-containing protein [Verrucomicrobiales bacterium]
MTGPTAPETRPFKRQIHLPGWCPPGSLQPGGDFPSKPEGMAVGYPDYKDSHLSAVLFLDSADQTKAIFAPMTLGTVQRSARRAVRLGALAVVVGLCLPAQVQAAQIVQMESFGPNTPNYNVNLTFNQFDTLGGRRTLTAVKVSLTLNVSGGDATADNDGVNPGTVTITIGGAGSLSSTDVLLLNSSFQSIAQNVQAVTTGSQYLTADDGDGPGVQTTGTDWYTLIGQSQSSSGGDFVNSGLWTIGAKGYIGTGTFQLTAAVTTSFNISGISGAAGEFNPIAADGAATVTYYYVPEPEAWAIASLPLLGLVGIALRRRARRD